MKLTLATPITDLASYRISGLSAAMNGKLAAALAVVAGKTDPVSVTVEDLLNYFPARYEDRSRLVAVDEIEDGMEAAVEIYVKTAGGVQVGRNRHPKQPPLYIFEIFGADESNKKKPVCVKWFISGKQANHILTWYQERFRRGTRFIAYGKWEWDERRQVFNLMMNKPDELGSCPLRAFF
jgi:RecG-like helicase